MGTCRTAQQGTFSRDTTGTAARVHDLFSERGRVASHRLNAIFEQT
jgi:hypothetical protein